MKKIIAFLIAIMLINQAYAQDKIEGAVEENVILSMIDCIEKAKENNPALKAAISDTDIFNAKIGQAKSAYFPELSFSTGYLRSNPLVNVNQRFADRYTDNYTLGAITYDQLFYDFGKTSAAVKYNKKTHDSSLQELKAFENELIYRVKEAYLNVLFALEKKSVIEETVNQFKKQLDQAQAFYEIGTRPKIDVTIARFNHSNSKLDLIRANNDVDLAYARLNNVMGKPEHVTYTVSDKLDYKEYSLDFDELIQKAYEERPGLKAAVSRSEASEELIKLSKKVVLPDFKGFTNFSVGGSDFLEDEGLGVGIALEIPVTNAYDVKKKVDEARATYEKAIALEEQARQEVFLEVKQAYIKYKESSERIPVSELSKEQAKENYELASGRYAVGLGDPIELKDAEVVYNNAKLENLVSMLEYNLAIANIERVIGTPLINPEVTELEPVE